ncbi:hypothetical protein KZX37_08305 [Microbacterium sp. EYE_5]|uniref:hypothetical protein n=1 Tax=unclassified Microbacterium TaxID=2609290 RepID=UPI002002E643|nr:MULTISPECIES: hypothetical protein [unclassified Microbacterium]MCK6081484.1 hypothetical protein [Microbacterium sp. EYE_382]MCK6086754.1 hypothetical protein [Microbacterium sp. EYE_384]MCK6123748.1 hypothetical protein [Microbacterium sp. EYE_80]MCK6126657.1 hypothetical protein [Microbacterium sp. EYE_79]MCK6142439.1 hypothetical protein [Microbacterium sp. EYE_39]
MTTQQMNAKTMSMTAGANPRSQNVIVTAVREIKEAQSSLTARQQAIRDAGRRRVAALVATGAYSLSR